MLRIIREDNLLAVQPRAFVVTTDSDHEFEVYLNLASRMKLFCQGLSNEVRMACGYPLTERQRELPSGSVGSYG